VSGLNFNDKVVLVTGAGRSIGRTIAESFADHGAQVAANDITPVNLDITVGYIRQQGGEVQEYVYDVAKKMPTFAMINQIVDNWGRIDIIINTSWVAPSETLLSFDEWDWRRTIDVNLNAAFFTIQAAAPVMQTQVKGGTIINVAPVQRQQGNKSDSAGVIAARLALCGLTQAAARELAEYNIRVNTVLHGEGDCLRTTQQDEHHETSLPEPEVTSDDTNPFTEGKTAALVMQLCCDAAAHISGQILKGENELDIP
jgi:NAD(P)-dependent dehydrogenase (short-subunit alcohol dehydrogenase family)